MNERANLGSSMYMYMNDAFEQLVAHCKTRRRNGRLLADDPKVKEKIGQAWIELEIVRLTMDRALSKSNAGETPGPEGSILKLGWSEANQRLVQLSMEVLGDTAQLSGFDDGTWAYRYLR